MAFGHFLATSPYRLALYRRHLVSPVHASAGVAHLPYMSDNGTVRDLFEPVLTLAELAEYLQVPVQTLYDLRVKGGGPRGFRVGRCLHFRKSEVEAWLAALEDEDAGREHSRDAS